MSKKDLIYENIADDSGIELWVTYEFETNITDVEGHGHHRIEEVTIDIHSIELVVDNKGKDIMNVLTPAQIELIKDKLSLERDSD